MSEVRGWKNPWLCTYRHVDIDPSLLLFCNHIGTTCTSSKYVTEIGRTTKRTRTRDMTVKESSRRRTTKRKRIIKIGILGKKKLCAGGYCIDPSFAY